MSDLLNNAIQAGIFVLMFFGAVAFTGGIMALINKVAGTDY